MSFLAPKDLHSALQNRSTHDLHQQRDIHSPRNISMKTRPPLRRNSNPQSTYTPLMKTSSYMSEAIPEDSVYTPAPTAAPSVYVLKVESEAWGGGEARERYLGVFSSLERANAHAELLAYKSVNGSRDTVVDNKTGMEGLRRMIERERAGVEGRVPGGTRLDVDGNGCLRVDIVRASRECDWDTRAVVEKTALIVD